MLRFLADENLHAAISRGLLRQCPELDLVRVQDLQLAGLPDPDLLDLAARQGRLILTHDASTMTRYAFDRVRAGLSMPGVIEIGRRVPIGQAIADLRLLAEASRDAEWENQVLYIPLS
jgi:hypothetical protein